MNCLAVVWKHYREVYFNIILMVYFSTYIIYKKPFHEVFVSVSLYVIIHNSKIPPKKAIEDAVSIVIRDKI